MGLIVLLVIAFAVGFVVYKYYPKNNTAAQRYEEIVKENAVKVEEKTVEVAKEVATEVKTAAKKVAKTAKEELAEMRARKEGKFVADDPATPNVNEAFVEGKAPPKKARKPKIEVAK